MLLHRSYQQAVQNLGKKEGVRGRKRRKDEGGGSKKEDKEQKPEERGRERVHKKDIQCTPLKGLEMTQEVRE